MLPTATALGNYRQNQPQHLAQRDDAIALRCLSASHLKKKRREVCNIL
jgi:hypothetical protein